MIMMKNIWKSNLIQVTSYLQKTIDFHSTVIVVRAIFHESNKYYAQVLLGEYWYKLLDANMDAEVKFYIEETKM